MAPNAEPVRGASFLVTPISEAQPIGTPEAFTADQLQFYRTAAQFMDEKVLPHAQRIEKKDYALLRTLLREAGELGLLGLDIPTRYGGLGLKDITSSMLLSEAAASLGSWTVTIGGQTGIGTMPIVWFGTEAQKTQYLPKLSSGEWISAYALTETGSGSDALGAKTKAVLSADGKHYLLTGSKQFITNAAFADVFIVFAKVNGEKFTGFIVDRTTPGLSIGAEEHKMGIRGSSTCPLILEDAQVPVENLLGEVGKGHKIAFNILNHGRLKLGVAVTGAMKFQTQNALKYAQDRKQFNTPIVQFELVREMMAKMIVAIYANESMSYRTCAAVDELLKDVDPESAEHDAKVIGAIEEFALESSILKVFGSEALSLVIDQALQIHGGYGYIEEFSVERAYRDQRINRIFEGTNEINRMLVTGILLKRAMKGQLPLLDLAQAVDDSLSAGQSPELKDGKSLLAQEARAVEFLKWMAVYPLKLAVEAFGTELEQHQDLLATIADVLMDAYALESMVLRTRQSATQGTARIAATQRFAVEALGRSYTRSRLAVCAATTPETRTAALAKLAKLDLFLPHDPVALREAVVSALEAEGKYPFSF
jgi:alkylation response protein AidB-like acyl-CoA dehydrogenase